jgi:hypothetical protein
LTALPNVSKNEEELIMLRKVITYIRHYWK